MFDKPNQLVFYINAAIFVFGVLVALLTKFIVIALIVAVCAALLIYEQIRQNKHAFSIADLRKILTVHDTCGKKATLTQTQMTTACHVDNSEYWFKNIRSIGSISNFRINNTEPAELRKENDSYQVCMKFPPELKVINGSDLTLTYQCEGAFTQNEGILSHVVDDDTKRLRLIVELPEGRAISTARFFSIHDGKEEALLPPVITGQTIEADIKNPKRGVEYCLQWSWEEEGLIKKVSCLF
ncbi:hypothetical protein C8R26_11512 [Nitrosomonas oligotropha]|uniref:Uncharacterized protein n=1 Tax=Nitrosomonas oligotropha TaxID=42354 RepID=A0A2T5HYF4_9PROT|nr:hypothetical protein [Nitrosomonas oligotropha]PTQ76613.1 hypothetical protein C8R26_11512 [Nitrosomonas oligotropha]